MLDASAVEAHAAELPAVAAAFAAHGFDADGVLARIGCPAFSDVPRTLRGRRGRPAPRLTAGGALIALFVRGDEVPRAEIASLLGEALALLERLGVVEPRGDALRASLVLLPVRRGDAAVWIAHDRHDESGETWAVMPPDRSSEFLVRAAPPAAGRRWLDLGCGSGVMALLAARGGAARVVAADVNPRAPAYVALGAALSGVTLETCVSNLFAAVPPGRWDVITFNVPWLYHRARARWQASKEGPSILTRLLGELDARLAETAAEALLHVQLPDAPEVLPERLVGLPCEKFRALSLRHTNVGVVLPGMLWIARPVAGGDAWAAERRGQWADDVETPFVERAELEALVTRIEGRR